MKIATIEDLERFIEPAKWFFEQTKLSGSFKPECFLNYWRNLISAGIGQVFYVERDGEVVEAIGFIHALGKSDGEHVASVDFWFVKHDDSGLGIALMFNRFLAALEEMEIKRLTINALYSFRFAQVSMFLERAGFVAREVVYQREVA